MGHSQHFYPSAFDAGDNRIRKLADKIAAVVVGQYLTGQRLSEDQIETLGNTMEKRVSESG